MPHDPTTLDKTIADAGFDATLAAEGIPLAAPSAPASTGSVRTTVKTCVLPKMATEGLVHHDRDRYEFKKVLGEGGMGEVALAIDHDIGRSVAVKHLHQKTSRDPASLARFVEEIHTVGALEHPNIVPIHDVGVGEDGRYFFVMKHVEGDTLETIIERLTAGDAAAHARFTFSVRIEVMVGLLRALEYAHAQGIVHRDIKPANVMIGPYGEVVLMDWGVAKAKIAPEPPRSGEETKPIATQDSRTRMFTTRHGSLVGTPAYMSPEQARGDAAIDERSDLYSAGVLFHEFITLQHYMSDKTTLEGLLKGVIEETPFLLSFTPHPSQHLPPPELTHFCRHILVKDPAKRYQSAGQMIRVLSNIMEGKVKVECPFTLTKRITREFGHFIDNYPRLAVLAFFGGIGLFIYSMVVTLKTLI